MTPACQALKLIILSILAAIVWTACLMYSQNFPYKSHWRSEKTQLQMMPTGAVSSSKSRVMMAGAQLNLQKYYGFQEMVWRQEINPQKISWKFKINKNSYLDIIFNKCGDAEEAIRISTENNNIYYEASADGKFVAKQQYKKLMIGPDEWYFAELEETGAGLLLSINQSTASLFEKKKFIKANIGFRSGHEGAIVSKLVIVEKNGIKHVENFFNLEGVTSVLIKNIFGLGWFLFFLTAALILAKKPDVLLIASKVVGGILAAGAFYFVFDFFLYSRVETNYIKDQSVAINPIYEFLKFETYRHEFFRNWAAAVGAYEQPPQFTDTLKLNSSEIVSCFDKQNCKAMGQQEYLENPKENAEINILFFGGSFGRGMGARGLNDAVFKRVHDELVKRLSPKKIRSVSYSTNLIVRDRSTPLLDYQADIYQKNFYKEKFNLVVYTFININSNQKDTLLSFVELNKRAGIKLLYLIQPISPEKPFAGRNRASENLIVGQKLQELLSQINTAWYDPQRLLSDPKATDSGIIWWDRSHLTSYGQSLLANDFIPIVLKNLQM